jgi:hypothetical protein
MDLYDKERIYINFNYHFDYFKDKELTRVEKQMYFFRTRMEKSPIYLFNTNRTNVRVMKREIDVLMDTYELKVKLQTNKIYLQTIKSYIKNHWTYTYHILRNFHDLNFINHNMQQRCWWFPNVERTYMFTNREFKIKNILEIFLREYTEKLFNRYETYCNQEKIKEHLQKVINT